MKIGDTVYQIDACRVYTITIQKTIYDCGHIAFDDDAIGKSVFLLEDDAKKALNGSGENG